MTTIVVQLPGCEKSYQEAARKASEDAGRETTEGVTGRRRKREEAMSAAQQSHEGAEATQYGGSAPE